MKSMKIGSYNPKTTIGSKNYTIKFYEKCMLIEIISCELRYVNIYVGLVMLVLRRLCVGQIGQRASHGRTADGTHTRLAAGSNLRTYF